MQFNFIHKRIP